MAFDWDAEMDRFYPDPQDCDEVEEPHVVCGCCEEKLFGKYYNLPVHGIVCWECLIANYEYTV